MADRAAITPPSDHGAAIVSAQLTALLLQDEDDTDDLAKSGTPSSSPSVVRTSSQKKENKSPPTRRPLLFSSMREALASSGRLKEEPGGYVIKHHSGGSKQQQSRSVERTKTRHAKQRSHSKSDAGFNSTMDAGEDEADAAGYTVTRRRSSCCDISPSLPAAPKRCNQRSSFSARGKMKTLQQQQPGRPRRGSMSALSQSSLLTCPRPLPSSSVPPGCHPRPDSPVLQPPPGLTSAASGWVAKAAAPAENANKIEEPPVEALWPEMKTTTTMDSGWAVPAAPSSSLGSGSTTQTWSSATCAAAVDQKDDGDEEDDLLTRLGVTL